MEKTVIGLVPLWDEEKDSIWMLPGYMDIVREAGAIPVILPLKMDKEEFLQLDKSISGYMITGGHDVDSRLYTENVNPLSGPFCKERDALETMLYHHCIRTDKPVLGICRGIQMINVLEGGTLYQDIPTEHQKAVKHSMQAPYDRTVHEVLIEPDTPLYSLYGSNLMVNSCHHQAVCEIGPKLCVMAKSPDGIIEALYRPDKRFVQAVQWHPEMIFEKDPTAVSIVKAFVDACR